MQKGTLLLYDFIDSVDRGNAIDKQMLSFVSECCKTLLVSKNLKRNLGFKKGGRRRNEDAGLGADIFFFERGAGKKYEEAIEFASQISGASEKTIYREVKRQEKRRKRVKALLGGHSQNPRQVLTVTKNQ